VPTAYLSGIFVDSDTDVACLSATRAARDGRAVDPGAREDQGDRRPHERLAAPVIHANVRPDEGQVELDAMTQDAGSFPSRVEDLPAGDSGARLDSAGYGQPFIERARQLGIRVVASHRGIGSDNGAWTGINSPRDVGPAAAANPGREVPRLPLGLAVGVAEDHPFNMADAAPLGVDRLIKTVVDNGLGPNATCKPSSAPPGSA
jgi:hypothetical protein